jgi:hypothetical protein
MNDDSIIVRIMGGNYIVFDKKNIKYDIINNLIVTDKAIDETPIMNR